MKQPFVKVVRKVDTDKQLIEALLKDLDYELSSLFIAMDKDDEKEIKKSKERLDEIRGELIALGVLQ